MRAFAGGTCLLLALVAGTALARADPSAPDLKPLRHLVFRFDVSIRQQVEQRLEALMAIGRYQPTIGSGAKIEQARAVHGDGRIVIDIVAATGDGGLVADVTEDSVDRPAPRARVAIHSNGRLDYAPDAKMNDEEEEALRLLARGLIGPSPRDVGASWSVEEDLPDYDGTTSFRVSDIPAPNQLKLTLNGTYRERGAHGFEGVTQGTVLYDPSKLVPLKAEIMSRTRNQNQALYSVTDLGMDLTLLEDSFGKN